MGSRAMRITVVFDTRIKQGKWISSWITHEAKCKGYIRIRVEQGSGFRSRGPVGYGPTMWVESRKSGDILHRKQGMSEDSLWRQQCRYRGQGQRYTVFPLVETRRTDRQSSRPPEVTRMLTTIVTRSCCQSCTPGVFISRESLLLRSYRSRRLNRTMERKMWLNTSSRSISFLWASRTWHTG